MATTELRGTVITLSGELPAVGEQAPAYSLAATDMSDVSGPTGRTVLNIFPSVDTGVCAASVRRFNELAAGLDGVSVVCVSLDLPMSLKRFCGAEGIDNVTATSAFRSSFGTDYGVTMADGPMRGLLARSVVVVDADGTVIHSQLVPQVSSEPDYDAALASL